MMYSSCPNVIKHFVPIKFSQASIDYITEQPRIKTSNKQKQVPFTNKKLQCLKNENKDYVLIFKNKSYKQYSPKKKVRYSSIIKEMKHKNSEIIKIINKQDNQLLHKINLQESERFQLTKPRRIQSMDKLRQFRVQFRDSKTKQQKRITFFNKNIINSINSNTIVNTNFMSEPHNTLKNYKQNKQAQGKKLTDDKQLMQNTSKLIQFKIRGSKAPKSETTDYYKQIKMDNNYILATKLFK